MSEAWVSALIGGLCLLLAAVVTAWINLRKSSAEIDKTVRGGVIEEWREITNRLQERTAMLEKEISELRAENRSLYAELSELRKQIVVRETVQVEQRREIRNLDRVVSDLQKPDTQAIADALAPKLAEAIATSQALPGVDQAKPVPVQVVPADDPLPVEVKVVLPKGMAVAPKDKKE